MEYLTQQFVHEITVGIGDTGSKAGIIKVGVSRGFRMTDLDKRIYTAAARAAVRTGVPIFTHLAVDSQPAIDIFDEEGLPLSQTFMQWNLSLGGPIVNASAGIGFDIGIPGLGLETRGDVQASIDWELAFGFGVDMVQGFYLDVSDTNELELNVDVTLPGAGLTGQSRFYYVNAVPEPASAALLAGALIAAILIQKSSVARPCLRLLRQSPA